MAASGKKISVPKKDAEDNTGSDSQERVGQTEVTPADEKADVLPKTAGNTAEEMFEPETGETVKDVGERSQLAVDMIVARTGALPTDVEALAAELTDQVEAEAKAEKAAAARSEDTLDALTLERRDHANTLRAALGLTSANNHEENVKKAKERNKALLSRKRDTSKDNVHNSRPYNWVIDRVDGGETIRAYNKITGAEYEGPADGLMAEYAQEAA